MYKIVTIVDKKGSALDRLAHQTKLLGVDHIILDVHPKRPDPEQILRFEEHAKLADIIDFQYFKTAEMLLSRYEWLKDKVKVLTHQNPYSIKESDWNHYDINVGNNLSITEELKKITQTEVEHIPITVDPVFWEYKRDWKPNDQIIMVAARIESKKGVLEVAKACKKAKLKLLLVGTVSNEAYMDEVMNTGVVEFKTKISDEELKECYHQSLAHICNSVDNFESGTMPILEAMCCGTPVISREVGHVPDLYNGENIILNKAESGDVDSIVKILLSLKNLDLNTIRDKAWNSAKNHSARRRSYMYRKLFRRLQGKSTPVSIVMPIYDKDDIAWESIKAVAEQNYNNIELIIVNDNSKDNHEQLVEKTKRLNIPIIYINSPSQGYGLARARNLGTIVASGDIIVYCDQRIKMQSDAVTELVNNLVPKVWTYGSKGKKKDFVENFSCIYRREIINAGMFNERINEYGGMSQEIRARTTEQGISKQYVESAKAEQLGTSKNRNAKRDQIIRMKDQLWIMGLR